MQPGGTHHRAGMVRGCARKCGRTKRSLLFLLWRQPSRMRLHSRFGPGRTIAQAPAMGNESRRNERGSQAVWLSKKSGRYVIPDRTATCIPLGELYVTAPFLM
ncbi:hypothetical protein RR42_s2575 [Cupriavidus basilensis]|uniref:Uncharacterized protein n=1 Tax=Cupriavidus basilensis TaxID=68895 RepID=A0A0C4YEM7_9BURK|nr:hypothetical protein RR42_s2575 [Cupriavidus basilensis]